MSMILFLDYDPEEMERLWNETSYSCAREFPLQPVFVDIMNPNLLDSEVLFWEGVLFDPDLRFLMEGEPFIIVINDDRGVAMEILDTMFQYDEFMSHHPDGWPHVIISHREQLCRMTLLDGREADSDCLCTAKSLEEAIYDIMPF